MKRVVMTVTVVAGLMFGTAFPVFGLGETQVTLNCDDGTSMTTTVDPDTLQSLVASVQAILDYPAGLTCTLLQSPIVSWGSVVLAGQKPPYINGGGRFVHDCPSGGGVYYTNFAVNAQTKNGDVIGSFHMKVPDGQCVNGGSLKTRATCFNVSESEQCRICADPRRDPSVLCVVEEYKDVVAIERTREFRGRYHVLGGAISPIDGIGPEQLHIRELLTRLADGAVTEVILATDPNLEGEATATCLTRMLKPMELRITRLASGLPVGGDLEYADEVTLGRAFAGRRSADD